MYLSDEQLRSISGICADVAQVCFASIVLPFLIAGFQQEIGVSFIAGLLSTLAGWILSVTSVRKIN